MKIKEVQKFKISEIKDVKRQFWRERQRKLCAPSVCDRRGFRLRPPSKVIKITDGAYMTQYDSVGGKSLACFFVLSLSEVKFFNLKVQFLLSGLRILKIKEVQTCFGIDMIL